MEKEERLDRSEEKDKCEGNGLEGTMQYSTESCVDTLAHGGTEKEEQAGEVAMVAEEEKLETKLSVTESDVYSRVGTELEEKSSDGAMAASKDEIPEGMTPHQWKVYLRKQRKATRIKEANLRRKQKEKIKKEKKKLERREKRAAQDWVDVEASGTPKAKKRRMDQSSCGVRVAIDLSYDSLMSEKDNKKVMMQCQRCYARNRRAENPLQLHLTSFSSATEKIWDQQYETYKSWDIFRHSGSYVELFGKENVIFLTSDSPNVLTDLVTDKVYVIGGLVDHNHQKGYCYKKALEMGIEHAQLPITQFVQLNSRTVLAINHVFEILLEFCTHEDWRKAFNAVIPPRKLLSPVISGRKSTCSDEKKLEHETSEVKAKESEASIVGNGIRTEGNKTKTAESGTKIEESGTQPIESDIRTEGSGIMAKGTIIKHHETTIKTEKSEIKSEGSEVRSEEHQIVSGGSEVETEGSEIKSEGCKIKAEEDETNTGGRTIKIEESGIKTGRNRDEATKERGVKIEPSES